MAAGGGGEWWRFGGGAQLGGDRFVRAAGQKQGAPFYFIFLFFSLSQWIVIRSQKEAGSDDD